MRICWAQYTLWAVIAVLGVISMLSGCGSKGDLYLPEETAARLKREKTESSLWKWESRKYASTGVRPETLESLQPIVEEAHEAFAESGSNDEWLSAQIERMLSVVAQQPVPPSATTSGDEEVALVSEEGDSATSEEGEETVSRFEAQRILLNLLDTMGDKLEPLTIGIDESDYTVRRYRLIRALSSRLQVMMGEAGNVVLSREQRKRAFDYFREHADSVAAKPPASEARQQAEKQLLQGMVAAVIQAPAAGKMTEETATRLLGEQLLAQIPPARAKIQELVLNHAPEEEIEDNRRALAVKEALLKLTGVTAGHE